MRLTLAAGVGLAALLVAGCAEETESVADSVAPPDTRAVTSAPPSPGATLSPSRPTPSGTTRAPRPAKRAKPGGTATAVSTRTGAAASVPRRVIMEQLRDRAERLAQRLPTEEPAPPDVDPDSNRGLGYQMLLEFGFAAEQWRYLDALWQRESNWNHLAENPSSGAYGIPQSLPATKMSVVAADWRTNPETQITWGLAYIAARYGSPQDAWAHSQRRGWY